MGLPTPFLTLKQLETYAELFQEQLQPQTKTAVSSKALRRLGLLLVTYDPEQPLKTFCIAAATQHNVLHSKKEIV